MKLIKLSKGKFAKVDDIRFDKINQYKWCCSSQGYAVRGIVVGYKDLSKPKGDSKNQIQKIILMHREVMNMWDKVSIDHIDGDKLNNQRKNLRIANKSQNAMNSKLKSDNTSGYKGVNWNKIHKRWIARVTVDGKEVYSRSFRTLEEAVKSRNEVVVKYHKEFTRL